MRATKGKGRSETLSPQSLYLTKRTPGVITDVCVKIFFGANSRLLYSVDGAP
jgi:hypothetical protein